VILSRSSIGDWLNGTSTPSSGAAVGFLVQYLQARALQINSNYRSLPAQWWEAKRREAQRQRRPGRLGRQTSQSGTGIPPQVSHLCRIFLCHSSGDKPAVRELYGRLRKEGFDVWLDEKNILPGQDWNSEIRRAVRAADVVIVCLSKASIGKTGYVQREIRMVLDLADEQPEDRIYVIPARLEECIVPHRLTRWQWVDLFDPNGHNRLLSALRIAAERLDLPVTAGELAASNSLRIFSLASPSDTPPPRSTEVPPVLPEDTFPSEGGSVQDLTRQTESRRGHAFTEATTPPEPGRGSAADSNESQRIVPDNLPKLSDCKVRLSVLLDLIDVSPDELDLQADAVHRALVVPVYELMRTEVMQACGPRWAMHDQQRFADRYRAAANKWPAYREALAELERARVLETSVNDAMVRLERPRSDYIAALLNFYDEFSASFDFLFPP